MKKFTLIPILFFATTFTYFSLCSYIVPTPSPANAGFSSLLNFDVRLQAKTRIVNWSDVDESGLDHFELQRSSSPTDAFSTVYAVYPQNTSSNSYSYSDNDATNGNIVYYRLLLVDRAGYAKLSNTIYTRTDINDRLTLYPNPARDNISMSFGGMIERANIKIVNQQGVTVLAIPNFYGNMRMQDISKFSEGLYYVQVVSQNGVQTSSFIKK